MLAIPVPEAVKQHAQISAGEISFVNYLENGGFDKNRVVFNQVAISFVLNGQKAVYRHEENTIIAPGYGILIPEGNSIMAEHSLNKDKYNSFIIFFPAQLLRSFLANQQQRASSKLKRTPDYILFERTAYLSAYIDQMQTLIGQRQTLSPAMATHKLNELLLNLYELYPDELFAIAGAQSTAEKSLKNLIEHNLFNNLTLDELAFLANRSLSSFKRDFQRLYGVSPQKYIRERKLETACADLAAGKKATELYLVYGYESLSNFNTAFKKKYGTTPAGWQLQTAV